jgi:hypothetical protein
MVSLPQFATGRVPGFLPGRHAAGNVIVALPRSGRADHAASSVGDQGMTEHSRPVHVLVVDDDPAIQDMVATYLHEYDMKVTVASGRQGSATCFL